MKKIPGRMKWNNITLKRGITANMDMWKWRKKVEQGKVNEARNNGSVVMHDQDGYADRALELRQRVAEQAHRPGGERTNNEVGVEELEITHEMYERVQ